MSLALHHIGKVLPPAAVGALCGILEGGGVHARSAARTLSDIRAPEAGASLRKALASPEPLVVVEAAMALGHLGAKEAVPELADRLRTAQDRYARDIARVKAHCAVALALLGDRSTRADVARSVGAWRRRRSVQEDLLGVAVDMMDADSADIIELRLRLSSPWDYWQALWLRRLVAFPGPRAVRVWRDFLAHRGWLLPSQMPEQRAEDYCPMCEAIETAGALAAPESLVWLRRLATSPAVAPEMRVRAVRVLARRGSGELPTLQTAVAHRCEDGALALALVDALGMLEPAGTILQSLAANGSGTLRQAAAETLLERDGIREAMV